MTARTRLVGLLVLVLTAGALSPATTASGAAEEVAAAEHTPVGAVARTAR